MNAMPENDQCPECGTFVKPEGQYELRSGQQMPDPDQEFGVCQACKSELVRPTGGAAPWMTKATGYSPPTD